MGHFLREHGAEGVEVGSSNTSDGVPSLSASETGPAARVLVVSLGDVVEGLGVLGGSLVDPGVEETKSGLACVELIVVEGRDDGGEGGSGGRSSTDALPCSSLQDGVANAESRHIRSSTSIAVVEAGGRQVGGAGEVGVHLGLLVGGDGIVPACTTGGRQDITEDNGWCQNLVNTRAMLFPI